MHGEYTANSQNYMWGHNHGIYQDRALIQLAVLFPNFEQSDEWLNIGLYRLSLHLEDGVTPSGIHKEHSPSYHYLVLQLFMSVSAFTNHYNVTYDELDSIIYKMHLPVMVAYFFVHTARTYDFHRISIVCENDSKSYKCD